MENDKEQKLKAKLSALLNKLGVDKVRTGETTTRPITDKDIDVIQHAIYTYDAMPTIEEGDILGFFVQDKETFHFMSMSEMEKWYSFAKSFGWGKRPAGRIIVRNKKTGKYEIPEIDASWLAAEAATKLFKDPAAEFRAAILKSKKQHS